MEILGGNRQCLWFRVCKGNLTFHIGLLTHLCYHHVHITSSALGYGLVVVNFACLGLPGACSPPIHLHMLGLDLACGARTW